MKSMRQIERDAILTRLMDHGCNITHTSRSLRVGIRTLQRKLKQYGYRPTPGPDVSALHNFVKEKLNESDV